MRSAIIQLLESGKALCSHNFPLFVDAWNWMNGALANLRGDYDLAPDQGYITVDDSLGFPVIRLTNLHKLTQDIDATTINGLSGDIIITGDDGVDVETDEETNTITLKVNTDEVDVVKSANAATGDIAIIGGKYIRVETNGKTIKITYDPTKTTEDEDPNAETVDPCDHPGGGSGSDGGVAEGDSDFDSDPGGGGGGSSGDGTGGVEADGDVHAGDPCNSEDCVTN